MKTRFLWAVAVVGFAFTVLAARLVYLQVVKGSDYRYQSENNRIRVERIPSPRGVIYDRNKEILADTFAAFDAEVIPSEIPVNGREELFRQVSALLDMPVEEIEKAVKAKGLPKWRPRVLKRRLTREEMARLEARRIELPGFMVTHNPVRTYPFGDLMGPVLGYMGSMTQDELNDPLFEGYDPSDYIGRAGIEKAWESRLRGTPGGVQVEVDVVGRRFGEINRWPATPGQDLVLTIDRAVQEAAEKALGEEAGSVVAIEVGTGRILAMTSRPGYDPNMMARGVTSKDWSALINDPRHPLQNRPVQGTYAPGSTFKVIMALAGLDKGIITPSTSVFCGGGLQFGGRRFRCWKSSGHGTVSLEAAIAQSCDVYFYKLGNDLGVDTINEYARKFGLGAQTGVDLPGEKAGLVPSTQWKRKVKKEPWYPGETLSVAIGQGSVTATPIQLANMIATVADPQGRLMRPTLVDRIESPGGRVIERIAPQEMGKLGFQLSHLAEVRHGLRQVVAAGTARSANIPQWKVAGKTGTAQVVGMGATAEASGAQKAWERRDNALFVCYAPVEDPKIAVAVIVDHGGHGGSAAAPIAAKVVRAYHDVLYPPPPELSPLGDETSEKFVGPPEWGDSFEEGEEGD